MTPQQTTWFWVEQFMYVLGTDGSVWRVEQRVTPGEPGVNLPDGVWGFKLVNAAGQFAYVTKPCEEAVTILVPTQAEAVMAIYRTFGREISRKNVITLEYNPERKKNTPAARRQLALHLLNFHNVGIRPDSKVDTADWNALLELHAVQHAKPLSDPGWYIPHVHA